MSAAHEIISALVTSGMDPVEAAALLSRAAVEMTVSTGGKSSGAIRQQRYRERNKGVTKRNETVTQHNELDRNETITNRNESVTSLHQQETHISYLPSSINISEKKESKKDRVSKKHNAPLPGDWAPSLRSYQVAEDHGVDVQAVEQIFRDYLKSSGKLYADYDAAFYNFLRNQRRFNGNSHAKTQNPRSGSLIAAIDRELAKVQCEENADFAASENTIQLLPNRAIRGP